MGLLNRGTSTRIQRAVAVSQLASPSLGVWLVPLALATRCTVCLLGIFDFPLFRPHLSSLFLEIEILILTGRVGIAIFR